MIFFSSKLLFFLINADKYLEECKDTAVHLANKWKQEEEKKYPSLKHLFHPTETSNIPESQEDKENLIEAKSSKLPTIADIIKTYSKENTPKVKQKPISILNLKSK